MEAGCSLKIFGVQHTKNEEVKAQVVSGKEIYRVLCGVICTDCRKSFTLGSAVVVQKENKKKCIDFGYDCSALRD